MNETEKSNNEEWRKRICSECAYLGILCYKHVRHRECARSGAKRLVDESACPDFIPRTPRPPNSEQMQAPPPIKGTIEEAALEARLAQKRRKIDDKSNTR